MKKYKVISFCTIMSLLFTLPTQLKAASIIFKPNTGGGYVVSGSINENDLVYQPVSTFWYSMHTVVHETDSTYYEKQDSSTNCSKSKSATVDIINQQLARGITANIRKIYSDDNLYWAVTIYCKNSSTPSDGGWIVKTLTPSPPNGAACDTSVPIKVSFGTLPVGTSNHTTVLNGNIKCNRDADVALSFRGFEDGYIPVEDAKVKLTFDNGQPTYKLNAKKNVTSNFKVNFQEISTGTTTGYKSASAVLVMQWQ